uniref:Uncharacterized protein n=1 Tax=Nelumbo nucifera TaxID=4432 RepID=A0A822Y252_NELNU|nr:TPA_asm: hypothetical protein HUJ06_027800 [Nelumbo nucifera]
MSTTADGFQENGGSDSDTNSDEAGNYYQPISAVDDNDEGDPEQEMSVEDKGDLNHDSTHFDSFAFGSPNFHSLSNGYVHRAENGIASLNLNGDDHENEEEEEEERIREASDSAIARAFREDESRRNAPLTPENASRIMEAMRGISFGGLTPDWAERVPEDRWIDQLRRLRQPPPPATTIQN